MSYRNALKFLLVLALGLPLVQATLLWVSRGLLAAMGDHAAASAADRVNLAAGVAWVVSLIGLIVVLAIGALEQTRGEIPVTEPPRSPTEEPADEAS